MNPPDTATRSTMDQGALGKRNPLILSRTRNILQQVIDDSYTEQIPDYSHVHLSSPSNQTSASPAYNQVSVPISSIFNKTWNLHRTTPFYNFHKGNCPAYETELLTYIAANAKSLSSTALITQTQTGMSTFVNENRPFPNQINSSGDSLIETLDHPGDIKRIEFQFLSLNDTILIEGDDQIEGEKSQGRSSDKMQDSLMITITIRPKGKSKDQLYYCVVLLDQLQDQRHLYNNAFTHFNLILLKAPVAIGQLVTQWLERKFDCRICRLPIQTFELRRIVNYSLEIMYNHPEGHRLKMERPVELLYTFPSTNNDLKSVSLSIPPDEARQLLVR
ncbi:hypothetical protein BG011_007616 [Mortierella polycephala]|uniref:Uncharacterized protein n=1 Tax=Mortierella polycephala TaxID=41804 RepID=A0A9P6PSX5_9FUNG|nr:hypothetical protein BG011_007616 [Mortierella polycephala]